MYLHHFVLGAREASVSELSVQFGLISTSISTILSLRSGKHMLVNYPHHFGQMSSAFVNYVHFVLRSKLTLVFKAEITCRLSYDLNMSKREIFVKLDLGSVCDEMP